jgi:hypothetical protein
MRWGEQMHSRHDRQILPRAVRCGPNHVHLLIAVGTVMTKGGDGRNEVRLEGLDR